MLQRSRGSRHQQTYALGPDDSPSHPRHEDLQNFRGGTAPGGQRPRLGYARLEGNPTATNRSTSTITGLHDLNSELRYHRSTDRSPSKKPPLGAAGGKKLLSAAASLLAGSRSGTASSSGLLSAGGLGGTRKLEKLDGSRKPSRERVRSPDGLWEPLHDLEIDFEEQRTSSKNREKGKPVRLSNKLTTIA